MALPNIDQFRGKLQKMSEADYLWQWLLPPNTGYSLLLGEPGIGKTNLAFQIAGCIVTGQECLGIPTKQARVGMVVFEGGDNLSDRIDKMENTFGRAGLLNNFDIDRWEPESIKSLSQRLIKAFQGYSLGIIDPFTKIHHGSINNTDDMVYNVKMLDTISRESGAHILVNHHVRKRNNDPRAALRVRDLNDSLGSGQLVAGSLTALLLAEETQEDLRRMGLAHHRGSPPKRGPDYTVLHFARAQASPEDREPLGLFRDRDSLMFVPSEGMVLV